MSSLFNGRFLLSAGRTFFRQARIAQECQVPIHVRPPLQFQTKLLTTEGEKPKYSSDYFQKLVKEKPIVLFMKGEPAAPMCGFSRLVVQILHMHGVDDYPTYDVLEDVEFKEGMKKFSNWPTFPQLYLNGELVGGSDILLQMHQSGELVGELDKIGHQSALIDQEN